MINAHNENPESTFDMGITEHADMDEQTFNQVRMMSSIKKGIESSSGMNPHKSEKSNGKIHLKQSMANQPKKPAINPGKIIPSVDWHKIGFVSPPAN